MRRVEYMLGGEDFKKMTAGHFMQSDVYYYPENASATDLISAMTLGGFGSVSIATQGKVLVGIVTEFDLLKAIMAGKDIKKITAKDMMTPKPATVMEETPAEKIMSILQEKHLIRVPVVDTKGVLVGVVARRDILLGYLKSLESPDLGFKWILP